MTCVTRTFKRRIFFNAVPNDWFVIVTDIVDFTSAIKKGLHNNINLVTTGSIITVLNKIKTIDSALNT
ncbi:hypothetical protein CW731_10265 [Polaribacter sp. ALD11]|uniref:DUF3095 family protein n=1 Tax=Polaribacter sp. ALD11 TaxID=2058137 RepID=UPI000C301838|nr:hypothetical protein CW731_10265 [Polaribacter sp. ALD11]